MKISNGFAVIALGLSLFSSRASHATIAFDLSEKVGRQHRAADRRQAEIGDQVPNSVERAIERLSEIDVPESTRLRDITAIIDTLSRGLRVSSRDDIISGLLCHVDQDNEEVALAALRALSLVERRLVVANRLIRIIRDEEGNPAVRVQAADTLTRHLHSSVRHRGMVVTALEQLIRDRRRPMTTRLIAFRSLTVTPPRNPAEQLLWADLCLTFLPIARDDEDEAETLLGFTLGPIIEFTLPVDNPLLQELQALAIANPSRIVRRDATRIVARVAKPESLPTFRRILTDSGDGDRDVRLQALRGISNVLRRHSNQLTERQRTEIRTLLATIRENRAGEIRDHAEIRDLMENIRRQLP